MNRALTRISGMRTVMNGWYRRIGKQALDRLAAACLIMVLGPLLLILAALVRWRLGSPILFKQIRPGLNGRVFTLLKFRSMREAYDQQGGQLPDELRLTWFGRVLRASSLDELPELWNVLRGEMSIVGPRPLLAEYLDLYTTEQARRHVVMPGLTGLAQIHGRNELSWEEKFRYDVWYVDNCSLWLDLKILLGTFGTVFSKRGISKAGHATTEKFAGRNPRPVHIDDGSPGVLVLGAGGHAKVVISTLLAAGHQISGVYDDAPELLGVEILGQKVVGTIADLPCNSVSRAIIAIGDSKIRQAIATRFSFNWVSVVHSHAWVDPTVQLGQGSIVMAGAVVQPNCRLGRHVIVNTSASIDHDSEVEDFVHICPGARLAGHVTVGQSTTLGTGSVCIPSVEIGANTIVGAGAVVTKNLSSCVIAVGQPARVIKKHSLIAKAA
jgi:sugar O-acyltransferase (sialic acid O-acetyltransferase NeuD family)